jgi:hypothetical protein
MKTRTCDVCGEGQAEIKLSDNLFYYECDTCHSEYSDLTLSQCNILTRYEYPEFEDWFNELQGFSMRSEWLLSHFEQDSRTKQIVIDYLKAAFECGRSRTK